METSSVFFVVPFVFFFILFLFHTILRKFFETIKAEFIKIQRTNDTDHTLKPPTMLL